MPYILEMLKDEPGKKIEYLKYLIYRGHIDEVIRYTPKFKPFYYDGRIAQCYHQSEANDTHGYSLNVHPNRKSQIADNSRYTNIAIYTDFTHTKYSLDNRRILIRVDDDTIYGIKLSTEHKEIINKNPYIDILYRFPYSRKTVRGCPYID